MATLDRKLAASKTAQKMISEDVLVIDIEATGLDFPDAVSICVVSSATQEVLIDTLVKPTLGITSEAQRIHNISMTDLTDAPKFDEVWIELERIRSGRGLTSFMTDFDYHSICYSLSLIEDIEERSLSDVRIDLADLDLGISFDDHRLSNTQVTLHDDVQAPCILKLAVELLGGTNRFKSTSLATVTKRMGIDFRGRPHSAQADALAAADVLNNIADFEDRYRTMLA